jgi:hypothetical protein
VELRMLSVRSVVFDLVPAPGWTSFTASTVSGPAQHP